MASAVVNTATLMELVKFVQIAPDMKQGGMTFAGMVSLRGYDDPLDGSIEAIATDGHRIASLSIPSDVQDAFNVLLPASLVPIIPTLTDEKTLISDTNSYTIVSCGRFTARANKFTTKFPDTKRMFPSSYDFVATVDAKEVREALGRIEPVMNEDTRAVKMTWANSLELRTGDKTVHGKDEAEYQVVKGRGFEGVYTMILDWKYLNDFFERVDGPVSCMYATGKPFAVFQAKDRKYLVAGMGK